MFSAVVRSLKVEVITSSAGEISVLVAPGAPFEPYFLSYGQGRWRLKFKDSMPATTAVSGFGHSGGFLFAGVRDPEEACLLLSTLFRIIEFDQSLCAFMRSLYDECLVSLIWSTHIYGGDRLRLVHEMGEISVTHANDQICVSAQPLDSVYERFMVWTGCFEGYRNGVLVYGTAQFVGGQEKFGSVLSFSFRFPDEEEEIRSLVRLLVSILGEHLQLL